MSWEVEYRAKMRDFIAQKGTPVAIENPGELDDYFEKYPRWTDSFAVSPYGWSDREARDHVKPWKKDATPCSWIVPEGAELKEVTYSEFQGTFTSDSQKLGVNVYPVHCACGKYTDVVLRWDGTLQEILHSLLGLEGTVTL